MLPCCGQRYQTPEIGLWEIQGAPDPHESTDLLQGSWAETPRTKAAFDRLKASLEGWDEANGILSARYDEGRKSETLDEETIDQLRALGYLN